MSRMVYRSKYERPLGFYFEKQYLQNLKIIVWHRKKSVSFSFCSLFQCSNLNVHETRNSTSLSRLNWVQLETMWSLILYVVCSMYSMCMYVVIWKIDHCIHIHWCIVMGLGHNDPWVESHMWPQQTWGQRSCRGQWPLVQVFWKKGSVYPHTLMYFQI